MRLWGSAVALGIAAASLLADSVQIVDVKAGKRFQISLPTDCFDENGNVKLAIRVLKPAGKVARLGKRTLQDSLEISRRRARSAPPATRRARTGRAILDVTVDWSSDQVNRPLGRPLRRASPRRVDRQRSRRPWRQHHGGRSDGRGIRRRYRDRWEESTLNVYPSSEVINHHYDTDEELSENDVWHPRNQMRRGLGRHQGRRNRWQGRRRYYDSETDSYDYRSRPRRNFGRHRTNRTRALRGRNESTTTGSDTETEEARGFTRRREQRVTGPVRQRYLNDFDEEISGELVARFSLPNSLFPSATPEPVYTNTRMRLRTTPRSTTTTPTEAPIVTPTQTLTVVITSEVTPVTSLAEGTAETPLTTSPVVPVEPALPAIDEAEIVTFQ